MKFGGKYLKRRLRDVKNVSNRLSRARYFRGHGVHSPFVYGIIREAFMPSQIRGLRRDLYDALTAAGISHHRAVQLQNLACHCAYNRFGIDEESGDMWVLTENFALERMTGVVARAHAAGATVCIMAPYASSEREKACRAIVAAHDSTSIDNRGYLLIFNNAYTPKQHFRI